ncbi:NAC domain containing protein [Melia azedarach]|uniref:NAC domain containing protein n=1 Tax=Melia azedarach TaxID=155640 RepID=A0ACC1YFJ5_MELAZ|nr:NAC domain containing protein [Melia azedarach]
MDDYVGYRFLPTEQEIISYFLERKTRLPSWTSPTILEVQNICKFEPWDLPKHSPLPPDDRVWYFFNVPASMSPNSNRTCRKTNIGYWKVTGKPRRIRDKQGKKEIGYRKILVFHIGRHPNGVKTNWVMHEYRSCNVPSNKVEYALFRLERKPGDSSDTCNEASGDSAFDSTNDVAAASEVNDNLSEELKLLLDSNRPDCNSLSQLLPPIQPEQRTSYFELDGNSPSEQMEDETEATDTDIFFTEFDAEITQITNI